MRVRNGAMAKALVEYADITEGMQLTLKRDAKAKTDGTPAYEPSYVVTAPDTYDPQVCAALVKNFRQEWGKE